MPVTRSMSRKTSVADILADQLSSLSFNTPRDTAQSRIKKEHDVHEILPVESNCEYRIVIYKPVKKSRHTKTPRTKKPANASTPQTHIKKQPTTRKKYVPMAVRRKVWNDNIGEAIGVSVCKFCTVSPITQMNFRCGYIISCANGGKLEANNLLPICNICSRGVGNMNMIDFLRARG